MLLSCARAPARMQMPLNTYGPKAPFKGIIKSVETITGPKATGETCHIIIETDGKIPFWEGQSYGVIPPVRRRADTHGTGGVGGAAHAAVGGQAHTGNRNQAQLHRQDNGRWERSGKGWTRQQWRQAWQAAAEAAAVEEEGASPAPAPELAVAAACEQQPQPAGA